MSPTLASGFQPPQPSGSKRPRCVPVLGPFSYSGIRQDGIERYRAELAIPPGSRQVERQRAAPIALVRNAAPMRSLSNENGEWA